jgi:hypothetical protein
MRNILSWSVKARDFLGKIFSFPFVPTLTAPGAKSSKPGDSIFLLGRRARPTNLPAPFALPDGGISNQFPQRLN